MTYISLFLYGFIYLFIFSYLHNYLRNYFFTYVIFTYLLTYLLIHLDTYLLVRLFTYRQTSTVIQTVNSDPSWCKRQTHWQLVVRILNSSRMWTHVTYHFVGTEFKGFMWRCLWSSKKEGIPWNSVSFASSLPTNPKCKFISVA